MLPMKKKSPVVLYGRQRSDAGNDKEVTGYSTVREVLTMTKSSPVIRQTEK